MGKNTQFNHYIKSKERAESLIFRVIRGRANLETWLNLSRDLRETNSYQRLSQVNKQHIEGMLSGGFAIIQTLLVEWRLYDANGNLVEINYKFDYEVCRNREGAGLPIGEHCWIGSNGKKIWSSPKKV